MHGVSCRNATLKGLLCTTPHERMFGVEKDLSKFRLDMHMKKKLRAKGRCAPKAVKAVNLGLAADCNTSRYELLIEETGKILISKQVCFDKTLFLYGNKKMVDSHLINRAKLGLLDVVMLDLGNTKWVKYEVSINLDDFEKIHSGGSSDSYILCYISDPSMYMGVKR
jgi:hypothetical protein